MTSTAPLAQGWLTADQCDALAPDVHHFGSTVGNLEDIYDVSVELRCWLYAPIDPAQVDPIQLIDDPNDDDGHAKFERIRAAVTRHERMPPVIVMHQPNESVYVYSLIEGRHRYTRQQRTSWTRQRGSHAARAPDWRVASRLRLRV